MIVCGKTYTRPEGGAHGDGAVLVCTFVSRHDGDCSWQVIASADDRRAEALADIAIPDISVRVMDATGQVGLWCRLCDEEVRSYTRSGQTLTPQAVMSAAETHRHRRHAASYEHAEVPARLAAAVDQMGRLLQPAIVEVHQQRWSYSDDTAKKATFHALHNAQSALAGILQLVNTLIKEDEA